MNRESCDAVSQVQYSCSRRYRSNIKIWAAIEDESFIKLVLFYLYLVWLGLLTSNQAGMGARWPGSLNNYQQQVISLTVTKSHDWLHVELLVAVDLKYQHCLPPDRSGREFSLVSEFLISHHIVNHLKRLMSYYTNP